MPGEPVFQLERGSCYLQKQLCEATIEVHGFGSFTIFCSKAECPLRKFSSLPRVPSGTNSPGRGGSIGSLLKRLVGRLKSTRTRRNSSGYARNGIGVPRN